MLATDRKSSFFSMDRLLKPVHHRIWSNPERCVQKLLRFSEEHAALARQHGGDKLGR